MIHPNMATMLAFITTDANVEQEALQSALKTVVDETFNMITVDGDTSTNDMVLLLANGLADNTMLTPNSPAWLHFIQGLETVCQLLAKEIAKDGEGATKLIEAKVIGAAGEEDAKKLAKSVIGSNLVKSAVLEQIRTGEELSVRLVIAASILTQKISVFLSVHINCLPTDYLSCLKSLR